MLPARTRPSARQSRLPPHRPGPAPGGTQWALTFAAIKTHKGIPAFRSTGGETETREGNPSRTPPVSSKRAWRGLRDPGLSAAEWTSGIQAVTSPGRPETRPFVPAPGGGGVTFPGGRPSPPSCSPAVPPSAPGPQRAASWAGARRPRGSRCRHLPSPRPGGSHPAPARLPVSQEGLGPRVPGPARWAARQHPLRPRRGRRRDLPAPQHASAAGPPSAHLPMASSSSRALCSSASICLRRSSSPSDAEHGAPSSSQRSRSALDWVAGPGSGQHGVRVRLGSGSGWGRGQAGVRRGWFMIRVRSEAGVRVRLWSGWGSGWFMIRVTVGVGVTS